MGSRKVSVRNLAREARRRDIKDLFSECGYIYDCYKSGRSIMVVSLISQTSVFFLLKNSVFLNLFVSSFCLLDLRTEGSLVVADKESFMCFSFYGF